MYLEVIKSEIRLNNADTPTAMPTAAKIGERLSRCRDSVIVDRLVWSIYVNTK